MSYTKKNSQAAAEARKAKLEELKGQFDQAVMDFEEDPELWNKFLAFAAQFRSYSFNNMVLIWSQNDRASYCAGFNFWRDRGTPVLKGERGLRILAPGTAKVRDEDGKPELDEDGNEKKRTFFFPVSVFDVSQTEAADEYEQLNQVRKLTGEDEAGLGQKVAQWLQSQGWKFTRDAAITVNGYTVHKTKEIVIRDRMSAAQQAKTIIHEAAHAILHQELTAVEYDQDRGRYESEAESAAYVVAATYGLDTSSYSVGYVAQWSHQDPEIIEAAGRAVITAAHTILNAIDPVEGQEASAA